MKLKSLLVLLAVSSVAVSMASADTYYLAYKAKSNSSGYAASGVNYVKANGKSGNFLLVKMTGDVSGDVSGLGDALYLVTDTKAKIAMEEPSNVQLRQTFDTKGRGLLFGAAFNIDNPQADPNANSGDTPATAVTCKDKTPYGTSEYLCGANAKLLDIGLVSGGAVVEKLIVRNMKGQDSGLRCDNPLGDNFSMTSKTSYTLDLDRTKLINTSGPTGAPPATLREALTELERSLPGGNWATL